VSPQQTFLHPEPPPMLTVEALADVTTFEPTPGDIVCECVPGWQAATVKQQSGSCRRNMLYSGQAATRQLHCPERVVPSRPARACPKQAPTPAVPCPVLSTQAVLCASCLTTASRCCCWAASVWPLSGPSYQRTGSMTCT
jgi:hypothetical protein